MMRDRYLNLAWFQGYVDALEEILDSPIPVETATVRLVIAKKELRRRLENPDGQELQAAPDQAEATRPRPGPAQQGTQPDPQTEPAPGPTQPGHREPQTKETT